MSCFRALAVGLLPLCTAAVVAPAALAQDPTRHSDTRTTAADVTILRHEAAEGDPESMVRLGIALEYGQGTKVNHVEALKWYAKSAAAKHPLGLSRLAWAFTTGIGAPPDFEQGRYWCTSAAERGDAFSKARMAAYGWSRPGGFEVALKWYRQAARQGDPEG